MLLQFRQQVLVERAGVTGRNVLAHVVWSTHAGNGRAHRRMRQYEAQRQLRQRHPRGKKFFQFIYALDRLGEILRTEISCAPVAFWKASLNSYLAAQAAFIEPDAGNYTHIN